MSRPFDERTSHSEEGRKFEQSRSPPIQKHVQSTTIDESASIGDKTTSSQLSRPFGGGTSHFKADRKLGQPPTSPPVQTYVQSTTEDDSASIGDKTTSSQMSRPYDERTSHSEESRKLWQSTTDDVSASSSDKTTSGLSHHGHYHGATQATPGSSEAHEASRQVPRSDENPVAPPRRRGADKTAWKSPEYDPHACSLVLLKDDPATNIKVQMNKLMCDHKIAGSVVVLPTVTSDNLWLDDYNGQCSVVTFSDETCEYRMNIMRKNNVL